MRRKSIAATLTAMILSFAFAANGVAEEQPLDLAPNAKSAIMIEMDTGTVLYEKNPHEKLPPASITKVMTMLLIMEALDKGQIKLTDKVRTSEYAASMGGSQIFLEAGEEMTVAEMLKGIAVASGNDASVAMAEHIAGTEEAFVKMMNEKAKELGLMNTHFVNSNGLPAENHYSSAFDIAMMSRELLKHEEITKYTGIYQDYLRKDSNNPFWLVNTNRLVRFYPGVDGLKTGYTSEAQFCLAATAKRGNMRVIAVVMGEPNTKTRNKEVSQMLDYAFSQYEVHPVFKKGEIIERVAVDKGKEEYVNIVTSHQVSILTKKGEDPKRYEKEITIDRYIPAPVEKGEAVGHIIVKKEGRELSKAELVAEKTVEKANFWELLRRALRKILFIGG
ncbi:D-alanyl-D-alanine carboxypeptidase DacF [Bacillaceae bacterium]